MSIRKKTLLTIGVTLMSVIVVVFITSRIILLGTYLELEEQNTHKNLQRALNAVDSNLAGMLAANTDWASWDDSYTFVQDGNETYIEDNLIDATFVTNNVNFIVYVDASGEVVFSKGYDLRTEEEIEVPAAFFTHLSSESPLLQQDITDSITGILMLPDTPLMIVASPILTSLREGPVQGTLLWGRTLDRSAVRSIAEATELSVDIYNFSDTQAPADVLTATNILSSNTSLMTRQINENVVGGYALINDIYDNPAFVLRVDIPRTIYAQGTSSLTYFLLVLLTIGIIFVAVATLLLDRLVLSRLTRLSSTVGHIRSTGDLSTPVIVEGTDEISSLADGMKGMLEALAQTQLKLQNANDELEHRVAERTAELSQTNTLLKQEIAERTQIENQLMLARDQALESLRLKTQILANISHDARTPLNIIMLRSEMLQRGRYGFITEDQHKVVENILLNSRQLLGFINNLLSEAQFNGDQAKLICTDFDPRELVEMIGITMQPLAEKKGLQIVTEIHDDIPKTAHGDPERLKQIVNNLIDNAIKFTEKGAITLRSRKRDNTHWVIEVSDTGMGIPADALSNIFEAFWQVDGSMTRTANRGVGLGLSIVKQLTTLMGGNITVDSQMGKGSTFTVTLPFEIGELANVPGINN